jgi:hypothetical protein
MSVELSQKGNNVRVTIAIDGASILADYESKIDSIESHRAAGLVDNVDSEGVATPKTPEQVALVNKTLDAMIINVKRELQINLLSEARVHLTDAMNAVAFDGADLLEEKRKRKEKIDFEFDTIIAKKPVIDVDVIKD